MYSKVLVGTEYGTKKGGIKVQTVLGLDSLVPECVVLSPAVKNDKNFLGQLA